MPSKNTKVVRLNEDAYQRLIRLTTKMSSEAGKVISLSTVASWMMSRSIDPNGKLKG